MINLSKTWKRIWEQADLENMRLHDLRHTAASIGVANCMNLRLFGHTQAVTTQRYAQVDINPALTATDQIGNVISHALGYDTQKMNDFDL